MLGLTVQSEGHLSFKLSGHRLQLFSNFVYFCPKSIAFWVNTGVLKRESKWHDLWSKWPISDLTFYNIKMPPCSCSHGSSLLLTGALKWGTVQTSTSTYTGVMKG